MSGARRPEASPAVKPIEVSADLKALMRRLKLGQLLDTLPERLALARSNRLPHHDFLEMLLADEVARRDRKSTQLRAKAAHLDPTMQLQAWDDTAAVTYDQQLWAELTSLRFLADAYNVLIMGPVGVGKTFLANALGHIAVRRHHSVHTERADKLFKRLRGARLDGSYEDEMRKLHRVELLIIDDLALHRLEATETSDFYELIVERHRQASTIITSNREPPEILTMMADPLLAQSRDGPAAICRLRTRRRRRVLPAAPETPTRHAGRSDSVGLTSSPLIGHHHLTARDRRQSGPMLMAKRWSHHPGRRQAAHPQRRAATTAAVDRGLCGWACLRWEER
jgi:DNA replication protein DnaC